MATVDGVASPDGGRAPFDLEKLDLIREFGVLALGGLVYAVGRVVVEGSEADATRNAGWLIDLERLLGIDIEPSVQRFALDHPAVRWLGDFSYVWLHWPLLLAVLWILLRRDPHRYLKLRNALFTSGAIGLVLFATVPMAPPRFMPGFVGTVGDDARRLYLGYPLSWTNRFAAFPSFHVGWTLIACLALANAMRDRRIAIVSLVPAALVALAVIATGNHYVIDSAIGAAIACAAYRVFDRRRDGSGQQGLSAVTQESAEPVGKQGGEVDPGVDEAGAGRAVDDQVGDELSGAG